MQGIANVSISFETKDMTTNLEDLLRYIRTLRGVIKVDIVGQGQ